MSVELLGCRCLDPAVFGHIGHCPLGGWEARNHSYRDCDCDACTDRRRNDPFEQLTQAGHGMPLDPPPF